MNGGGRNRVRDGTKRENRKRFFFFFFIPRIPIYGRIGGNWEVGPRLQVDSSDDVRVCDGLSWRSTSFHSSALAVYRRIL